MATATDAVAALDQGRIKTAFCSKAAFQLIENLPQEQAIPILIRYLGFRRPDSNEAQGLRSQYPAVEALARVGLAAEPALIDFIAHQEDENSLRGANALEAVGLLRHGDVVPTIKLMRERSVSIAGTEAAKRLNSAAQYLWKTYCSGKRLLVCEREMRESAPEK